MLFIPGVNLSTREDLQIKKMHPFEKFLVRKYEKQHELYF